MVVSTSRTGRVRPDDWVVLGSSKSLRTTATPAQYLRLLLAMTAQPRELASDSVIPRLLGLQLTSQACPSGPVAPSRSPRNGFPWLHYRYHWTFLTLASCASLVASQRRAWHAGRPWQGRAGQGGSGDASLTMMEWQRAKQVLAPRPAGCQAWPLAGPAGCFNHCQRPLHCYVFIFSCPIEAGLEQDFHQIVQPSTAASRQQQRSSAACLHGSLRIRMSAILAGRLGI